MFYNYVVPAVYNSSYDVYRVDTEAGWSILFAA